MKHLILSVLTVFLLVISARAGWYIEMTTDGMVNKMYFDGNDVVIDDENSRMILNAETEEMIMVNTMGKTYWKGNLSDFSAMLKASMEKAQKAMSAQMEAMKEQMKNMPAQQQEMMKKMFSKFDESASGVAPKVKLIQKGTEKVGEYSCDVYDVMVNGELKEKLWLSDEVPFFDDMKNGKTLDFFTKFEAEIENAVKHNDYKSDGDYMELNKSKFPVKMEEKEAGYGMAPGWIVSELTKVEEMDIDKYLKIPEGFKEAPLENLMSSFTGDMEE